jgi:hypothetical protein
MTQTNNSNTVTTAQMVEFLLNQGKTDLIVSVGLPAAYAQTIADIQLALSAESAQPAAVPAATVESLPLDKVKEMMLQQEHSILSKLAAMLNTAPVPAQQVIAEATVVTALPVEKKEEGPSTFDVTRFIIASATVTTSAATSQALHVMTDLVANAVSILGHGLADGVEKGGLYVGNLIAPSAARPIEPAAVNQTVQA